MSNYPLGADNDSNAPFNEETDYCKKCGETIFKQCGSWLHWDTGEEECKEDDSGLYNTLGSILNPEVINQDLKRCKN